MGLRTFFNRLFDETAALPAPKREIRPQASPAAPFPPDAAREASARRAAANALLHREEVLDARNRIYGYRFSMRPVSDAAPPTEQAFLDALDDAAVAAFAQRRLALIPISAEAVGRGAHERLAAPHAMFLLDLRQARLPQDEWLALAGSIHASGSRVALAGIDDPAQAAPLAAAADLLLFRFADSSPMHIERLARELRTQRPQTALGMEGLPSWAERRMCASWGFEYCLGDFLATQDGDDKETAIDQNRLLLIELLNRLRDEADLAEIAQEAKKDPGIAFQVLAMANSPASGLVNPVSSLEQAILVLGRERLYRWLLVSMFRIGSTRDRDEALLEVALARARFMETIAAGSLPRKSCEELFLVGLLSLFDLLLAVPMPQVLSRMQLAEPVVDVLLHSRGPYARHLMLALALEKGRAAQAVDLAAALGIPADGLQTASMAALAWAGKALGHSRE